MTNLLKKIPVYLAAFSTLLLPNAFAQDSNSREELVTIAEREVNGKTIEYRASKDVAEHMQFLSGYASSMALGYNITKFFLGSKLVPKEAREKIAECLKPWDSREDGVITEEAFATKNPEHYRCEVDRKIGGDLVNIISLGDKKYRATRAIEEHLFVDLVKKLSAEDSFEPEGMYKSPIVGFKDRMTAFSIKADENKNEIVSAKEYLALREKVLRKVPYSEFARAIKKGNGRIPAIWEKIVERNWDFVDEAYFVKFVIDIYNSPDKFMEENFSKEERKEIKSVKLEGKIEEEQMAAFEMIMPWINLNSLTLADKVFLCTIAKAGGDMSSITDLFSRDEPYVEKRVIREGPLPLPYQRDVVK